MQKVSAAMLPKCQVFVLGKKGNLKYEFWSLFPSQSRSGQTKCKSRCARGWCWSLILFEPDGSWRRTMRRKEPGALAKNIKSRMLKSRINRCRRKILVLLPWTTPYPLKWITAILSSDGELSKRDFETFLMSQKFAQLWKFQKILDFWNF